jgi:hypothetical protein
VFRLLPFAFADSDDRAALWVSSASCLWWIGAEVLDDLTGGAITGPGAPLSSAEALVAGTACVSVLPQAVVQRWAIVAE